MRFCTKFFRLCFLTVFGGVRKTNRYLSVAFLGIGKEVWNLLPYPVRISCPLPLRTLFLSALRGKVTQIFPYRGKNTGLLPASRGALFFVPLYFSCRSFARYTIILQTKELVMNRANVKVSFYLKKARRMLTETACVMATFEY